MRNSKNTLYVGPFLFPDGGAEARRVSGIALSLLHGGYKVRIGSGGTRPFENGVEAPPFDVKNLDERPAANSPKISKLWRSLSAGGKTASWVGVMAPQPAAILLYGARLGYLFRLIPWCRTNRIPLIVDVVEWYDAHHVLGGPLGPFHLSSELAMRYFHVKARHLIVISRFLERYYVQRGCRTIRIPPTLDVLHVSEQTVCKQENGPLVLAYAGVPGKKDLLNNVVEALLRLDPGGHKVRLVVAGPKPDDLLRFPSLQERKVRVLPGCVTALGQLTHDEALSVVRDADFTVLLRPSQRYAQAGFPTKVPESLAVGTPVICNLTSDLGDYINDGQEGLICEDHSTDSFLTALCKAMHLNQEQKQGMRLAARKQAEQSFDYRNYAEPLSEFIQEAIKECR